MIEMNFMSSFCDAIAENSAEMLKPQVKGFMSDYMTVSMTRLNKIFDVYGKDSEEYKFAARVSKQVVSQTVDSFKAIYPDGVIQILSVSPETDSSSKRDASVPDLTKRLAAVNTACPKYFSDCMTLNNNCSNHGMCAQFANPRIANQTCFFCSCYTNNTDDNGELIIGGSHRKVLWSGPSCSKQDISADFHLLFWTTLGLVVVMIVGSGDEGSYGAGSGKKKDE
ncbi:hypothetical protein HDU98_004139 [Podochytrium sp. JEL0797]|nr:hypothetical protein HDU98_004139 [Podochytrium sp. JEL0797]